jgi:hypothetical protein
VAIVRIGRPCKAPLPAGLGIEMRARGDRQSCTRQQSGGEDKLGIEMRARGDRQSCTRQQSGGEDKLGIEMRARGDRQSCTRQQSGGEDKLGIEMRARGDRQLGGTRSVPSPRDRDESSWRSSAVRLEVVEPLLHGLSSGSR